MRELALGTIAGATLVVTTHLLAVELDVTILALVTLASSTLEIAAIGGVIAVVREAAAVARAFAQEEIAADFAVQFVAVLALGACALAAHKISTGLARRVLV